MGRPDMLAVLVALLAAADARSVTELTPAELAERAPFLAGTFRFKVVESVPADGVADARGSRALQLTATMEMTPLLDRLVSASLAQAASDHVRGAEECMVSNGGCNTTTASPSAEPTTTLAPPVNPKDFKVVCYFTSWAWYRKGIGSYFPKEIDANLCTHIVYYLENLDARTLTFPAYQSDIRDDFMERAAAYREKGVKVTVAIGGWHDSANDKYSRLVNDATARKRFVDTTLEFIEEHDFDGLDLAWFYPKCWQGNCELGPESDKEGFAALVAELRAAFDPKGYLLSATVSGEKAVIDAGYDVQALSRDLDWITVKSYEYGVGFERTVHKAPLYHVPGDTFNYSNANFSMHYWMAKGADKKKLVMGINLRGTSFNLVDKNQHGLNSKSSGPGKASDFVIADGQLPYYEVCGIVNGPGWTIVRDPEFQIATYAYGGDQWISYDDVEDVRLKSKFIREMGFAGGMIYSLDMDDFRGQCGCGKYPLLSTMNEELRGLNTTINCTTGSDENPSTTESWLNIVS